MPQAFRILIATLVLSMGATASANPTLTSIKVETAPALAVAGSARGKNVLSASGGARIELAVTARYSDGTSADVTSSGTTYTSLDPGLCTVSPSGAVVFAHTADRVAAAVLVQHGALSQLVPFQIEP